MSRLLIFLVALSVRALRAISRTREALLIENLALRQQVAALKKERPRPVLDDLDRAFWVALRTAMAGLGDPIGHRKPGYRRQVASRPIPTPLGEAITAKPSPRTASNRSGDSTSYSPDGGEWMGCASYPR